MHLQHCTLISCPPLTIQKLKKNKQNQCTWEQILKQEKDSKDPAHLVSRDNNPKIEEIDPCQGKDMTPEPDMKADPDIIDLNLLVEDKKNWANVIDHEHN